MVGRFNLGTPDPNAEDAKVRVRGLGVMISTPDGQQWRMAMINAPIFPVSTPDGFHALQLASASTEPDAMAKFAGAHPEIRRVRRLGDKAALDRQLRRGALQQPQQLHLHRQFGK